MPYRKLYNHIRLWYNYIALMAGDVCEECSRYHDHACCSDCVLGRGCCRVANAWGRY